ncbi:hypothetical protein KR200_011770 [Drosophila serrata]|nr:hypothetical protein KR200_011770 [Drosophila serrata]
MAFKTNPPEENSTSEGTDESGDQPVVKIPTKEDIEILQMKIEANNKELNDFSCSLVNAMLASVVLSTYCPPGSEILQQLKASNEDIGACVEEVSKLSALLTNIKDELEKHK